MAGLMQISIRSVTTRDPQSHCFR